MLWRGILGTLLIEAMIFVVVWFYWGASLYRTWTAQREQQQNDQPDAESDDQQITMEDLAVYVDRWREALGMTPVPEQCTVPLLLRCIVGCVRRELEQDEDSPVRRAAEAPRAMVFLILAEWPVCLNEVLRLLAQGDQPS